MNNRAVNLFLAILVTMIFVPSADAQRPAGIASARTARPGGSFSRGRGPRNRTMPLGRGRRSFDGLAYSPYFYSDYDSEPEMIEEAPPQITEQTSGPASMAPVAAPAEPLVLELRGDHWVRITNYGQPQIAGQFSQPERASRQPSAIAPASPRRNQAAEPPGEAPRAVLVFQDGHKEEIGNYMIVGATIYANADYWSGGSWTRKVEIAELDVPATLKMNQERGAKFSLPSGPSEVMLRM
jgi:hypothetical protein